MGRKLKWAGPKHKTPRMKIIMAVATWKKKKKKRAPAEMQCKSAEGKSDELAGGQGGYSIGHGEGYWSASPVKQCCMVMLA